MTKTRPDQPGRCPSIDPHDTLQCTRAIHDDDQCQAGGIAWRKGSPRIEWDRERADRLQEDVERMQKDVERLTAEREWFKDRFPCDGACVDAPEEACSRHGRTPEDLWRIIVEVAAERDAQTKRAERLERWYADALTMLDKSRRWKSIASLTAERDALAARLALVEALAEAEVARLTAERDALAAQVAEGLHLTDVWASDLATDAMVNVMDGAVLEAINEQLKRLLDLRDALAGSEADTSDTQPTDQEDQA